VASTAEMQLPGTPADQVLAQSPPANASQVAAPRTSLLVTVAADPLSYVMPNFVGQPLGSAGSALQDAGFKLGTVSMVPPPADNAEISGSTPAAAGAPLQPSPASMIVTQWPPAGQKVLAGAVVNFEVR
jgi:beta-lactam-binding protein with PASTA domain